LKHIHWLRLLPDNLKFLIFENVL